MEIMKMKLRKRRMTKYPTLAVALVTVNDSLWPHLSTIILLQAYHYSKIIQTVVSSLYESQHRIYELDMIAAKGHSRSLTLFY